MENLGDFDNIDIKSDDDLFVSALQQQPNDFYGLGTKPELTSNEEAEINLNGDKNLNEELDDFIDITIPESQKIGDGMGAYVAYKVVTRTNIPIFKKKTMCVMRRFSDFLGLHDKLTEKYLRLGRIIPPAPEKSVIGMTKIKMSNQNEQAGGGDFVERRKQSLERYLRRTAKHPVLRIDPDVREFLESDLELPKATNTSALSGAGVKRLFNKVGETVHKITFKMDESDSWFEEKIQQVENLDTHLRKIHESIEMLVVNRRDLATFTSAVSKSAAMLSNCEVHTNLSRALSQLHEVEDKIEGLHNEQANVDFFVLAETLKDYIGLLGAVKDAFHERTKVFQNWQHAQQMLSRRRESKTKLELLGRSEKLDQASAEVLDWESKVERGQQEFDNISKMIKKEMESFEETRITDLKNMFIKYLEEHMELQLKAVTYWESFLPEAKAIV